MRLAMTRIVAPPRAPHRRYVRQRAEPAPAIAPAPRPTGLYPGEPETCRRSLRRFTPVLLLMGLLVAVAEVYNLEGRGFRLLLGLAAAALPVHYLLPFRWKKPFFVAASVAGLALVFGGRTAGIVLPAALGLIGLSVAPLPWRVRVLGVLGVGAALGLVRAGAVELSGLPSPVLPILGTMFMFRLIIFLYELKHAERPEPAADVLSYFFLLPNYCFLHFPVVDYRTMQRGYFSAEVHAVQRDGLRMMLRGFIHLLLYRLVYHELLISPEQVAGPAGLARFLVCNYLLYLHVSGQFHVACGMLHLFGFKLPETHHHYLLATGFTDYWRRINIYWKDFMVRVFFNPVAFRLKRRPQWQALAAATAVVFVATWFLHAYQSFWLSGEWHFSVPDALFWGVLGALVLVNVQRDARRSRGRRPRTASAPTTSGAVRAGVVRAAKVLGTFATITLLWSLWTSPSLDSWLAMLRRGLGSP
ncbi:hypothetical protein [Tautonia sociabilis]|uniref:MBOAT family protein n=1 Tax=Tautonia sociabilis TaxID=2080755 RepID=A0A432MC51_9BACT|nr:hypothetical protein [Tautonia sociabilis]RUL81620.1 hypothetical protein TsocGM_24840 [Tautonia sociabilis]